MQQILIIGSQLDACKDLKYSLQDETIRAFYTLSYDDGLRRLIRYGYQLVVLDVLLSENNLLRTIEHIKIARSSPILVLSPFGGTDHVVQILSVADDFLQKPFDIEICRARIKALLRRPACVDKRDLPSVLSKDGTLRIDSRCRKIYILKSEVVLPRKQYDLLYLMASNEGRVFTREQLLREVWGEGFIGGENTLNNQIGELRNKLKSVPDAPEYIRTVHGVGYCFDTRSS